MAGPRPVEPKPVMETKRRVRETSGARAAAEELQQQEQKQRHNDMMGVQRSLLRAVDKIGDGFAAASQPQSAQVGNEEMAARVAKLEEGLEAVKKQSTEQFEALHASQAANQESNNSQFSALMEALTKKKKK